MKRNYDDWQLRTAALIKASDLPEGFVNAFLARRRALRKLFEQRYAPADVLMHLRRKHAASCRFHERGKWYRDNRKWVQYAAYQLGYDLQKPSTLFAYALIAGMTVVVVLVVIHLVVRAEP